MENKKQKRKWTSGGKTDWREGGEMNDDRVRDKGERV